MGYSTLLLCIGVYESEQNILYNDFPSFFYIKFG